MVLERSSTSFQLDDDGRVVGLVSHHLVEELMVLACGASVNLRNHVVAEKLVEASAGVGEETSEAGVRQAVLRLDTMMALQSFASTVRVKQEVLEMLPKEHMIRTLSGSRDSNSSDDKSGEERKRAVRCSQKLPRATYEAVECRRVPSLEPGILMPHLNLDELKAVCDSVLKEFKEAEYMAWNVSPEKVRVFELQRANVYMHFTSPIRRYADILVHRRLAFILGAQGDLESQSSHGVAFLESLKEAAAPPFAAQPQTSPAPSFREVINCNTKKRDAQDARSPAQMEEIQTVLSDYVQRSGGIDVDDAVLTRILVQPAEIQDRFIALRAADTGRAAAVLPQTLRLRRNLHRVAQKIQDPPDPPIAEVGTKIIGIRNALSTTSPHSDHRTLTVVIPISIAMSVMQYDKKLWQMAGKLSYAVVLAHFSRESLEHDVLSRLFGIHLDPIIVLSQEVSTARDSRYLDRCKASEYVFVAHPRRLVDWSCRVLLEKLQRLSVRLATVGAQAGRQAGKGSGWQDLERFLLEPVFLCGPLFQPVFPVLHWAIRLPWAEAAEKAPGATRAIDSTTAAAPAPTWCCVAVRVIPCAVLAAPVSSMGSTRGVSPMESMEQSKEEKVMPAEEGKPDTEEEPLHKLKSIAWGAGASMLAYGVVETLAEGDAEIAEDAVDFLHSTYTSCVAVSGISSLQPHSEHRVALPEDMAQIDGDGDRDIDGEGSADDEEVWLDDEGIAMQLNAYAAVASELEEDTLGEEYAEARCRGGIVVPALEQFRETLEGIDEHLLGDCLDRSEIKIFGAEVDRRFMAARHEMEEEAASCSDPVRRQSIIDEQNENKNQVIQLIGGARDYRIKLYVLLPLRLHGFVKPELYGLLSKNLLTQRFTYHFLNGKGRGPVVRMFCHSLGYFLADVGLILVRGGVFRNWPKLWAARLTHHFIQTCAVSPCLFRTRPAEALALRSVLCIAYFAEFSNIFLRLSNFLRRRNGSISLRRAVNLMLLGSFAASRMFNFAFAMRVFWLARAYVHPRIFQMLISIQASGYMLNLAWFVKIAQIAAKSVSIPSVEC
ncbi:hypothetical protein AK812_SmicGene34065 [Symbiodinium microadriaticum]|uniref:TLC domain-containing protein n=1 Tax=Symbiodinium microadriaticum TaxID=2951 RepID=A0A1Q9CPZ0_SYMMI|nr:hypothetical protein AK812_SmicGene34065 [Symbiodinium microadriaticum]